MTARTRRGAATQTILANHLQHHGWPYAQSTGAGRSGPDITGTPGVAVEVKARADFKPLAWLKQAKQGRGTITDLPCVVWRPNGYGAAKVGEWPVMLTVDDFVDLLRDAGYGT